MDRNALAELLQALESRRDAEERRREERYTALIERVGLAVAAATTPTTTPERAAARQYSPVGHGSDTERSALLRRAEHAEALVQDRERLGEKSQQKETKQKIVLAGKTLGRPHMYLYSRLREQQSVGRSPGSYG
ncbi:UNVERIFIED_CONTAM: hypothetical protein FKN15_033384 [Acipenser sinensis]